MTNTYSSVNHFTDPVSALINHKMQSSNKRQRSDTLEETPTRKTIRYFALSDDKVISPLNNHMDGTLLSTGDLVYSQQSAEGIVEVFLHSNFIENIDVPRSQAKMMTKSFHNMKPIAKYSTSTFPKATMLSSTASAVVISDHYRVLVMAIPSNQTGFATLVFTLVSNDDGRVLHVQKHDVQLVAVKEDIVSVLCIGKSS
jgi:hypothetical protein